MHHDGRPLPKKEAVRAGSDGELSVTLDDLRATLHHASSLLHGLIPQLQSIEEDGAGAEEAGGLRQQLAELNRDQEMLTQQLIEAEHQNARTIKLYVATYQLHASLDPEGVQAAISEVAVDLLGAKTFVLLLPSPDRTSWRVAFDRLGGSRIELFAGSEYSGGDPNIDAALEDEELRIDQDQASSAIAVVPLRVEDEMVGVLAVFDLLEHKSTSLFQDRDLLDVLSAHAGSALLAAEVYASTRRKLRTLRDLVSLLPGSAVAESESEV